MKFDPLQLSRLRAGLFAGAALLLTGAALRPLEAPAWNALRAHQPALELKSLQGALGQGLTVGLLGGFRAIAADLFWIRSYVAWENQDLPGTQTLIQLVTTMDPRPAYFWINGARTIAYDMPHWRIATEGGYEMVPAERQTQFDREQADIALKLLKRSLTYHPRNSALLIEIANIHLNKRKDPAAAAEFYKLASEQPDAPYFAARLHAEMLKRVGRKAEAYAWLKGIYPKLPKPGQWENPTPAQAMEIEMGMADVVLDRIRELEKDLAVPPDGAFKP